MVSLANAIIAAERGCVMTTSLGLFSLSSMALIRDLKAAADTGQAISHFSDTTAEHSVRCEKGEMEWNGEEGVLFKNE